MAFELHVNGMETLMKSYLWMMEAKIEPLNFLRYSTSKILELLSSDFEKILGKPQLWLLGLEQHEGNFIISMDGDLQNDPSDIPGLLAKIEEGYDVVCGWRKDRKRWISIASVAIADCELADWQKSSEYPFTITDVH